MGKKTLIVFTRYPEVGKTKTRLIPAIGAEKATILQKELTEKTLQTVLQVKEDLDLKIYFSGGNLKLFEDWLGKDLAYFPQEGKDLGEKMFSAIETNYFMSPQGAIIIGIDCPFITPDILLQGLRALDNHDMVIGEAEDGGYYLIGLRKPKKELFTNINWGTDEVFQRTMQKAKNIGLKVYNNLPVLRDIDRPEDLDYFLSQGEGRPSHYHKV
ncbi:MAG: TIGR04282 family arsenosugar biosynthesis glycosyltransferase [Cyanobacterium sp. T60_A2020_053]|nr:TIGR04282 family arsenosugar biosynthesis glycosyltransferase [Cyanobacterium sp. T60_A2020_053]